MREEDLSGGIGGVEGGSETLMRFSLMLQLHDHDQQIWLT